jgi:hypothetical protein
MASNTKKRPAGARGDGAGGPRGGRAEGGRRVPPDDRAGEAPPTARRTVERVQTGVRLERRLLNVLKALADLHAVTLGDLLEGIVLHAFEGKAPFSEPSLAKIGSLKAVFGLDLTAEDSHLLVERRAGRRRAAPAPRGP